MVFFYFFFNFLVSSRIWLAKQSSCPAISCSWAATRFASVTVFLISFAFCFNLSSFPFNSLSSLSISFLSSISAQSQWLPVSSLLPFLLPGITVKMTNPPIIICLLLLTYLTPSPETQGQIVGARESLNGRKNMARRKVKNSEKSPWGQCLTRPVPNGRRRSVF